MDHKARRRGSAGEYKQRSNRTRNNGRKILRFLQTNKNILFTGVLSLLMVLLLFGIFSRFQSPSLSSAPAGVTAVDYSKFVQQVNSGQVIAVTIRGNDVNGWLLKPSAAHGNTQGTKNITTDAEYQAWYHAIAGDTPISAGSASAAVDQDRAIYTRVPTNGEPALMSLLLSNNVKVATLPVPQANAWLDILWRFLPVIIMVVMLLVFFLRRNASPTSARSFDDRITQMGRSRARRFERIKETTPGQSQAQAQVKKRGITAAPWQANKGTTTTATSSQISKPAVARVSTEPPITFADVAGIDEVRTELEEIVGFLRSPDRFNRLGARIPRGALLVGPPGTGKTLLAKAVAGEAGVPFFSMSASEFVEMFVGVGASRVRDLFNQARQVAPCVIFIDEIDAVGRKRTMRAMGNDERDQTLNQLLVELDGFDERQAVVVLAATNRVDILDKALLRPGRFDRRVTVSLPDRVGREAILRVHTRKTPLHEEVSLERLARMSAGMSGADLANLVNEAALSAARRDMEHITHDCFEEALARVQLGALRPLVMSEKERRIIAYHEGGHALVAHLLPEADTVNRVTILPRGQSLGVTQFTAEEDRYNYSRNTLMTRIAVGLGGRVAEELAFGLDHITTGAENDLQVVTNLARNMVTRWGMSEQVGVVFADYQPGADYSLNMRAIDPDTVPSQARSLVMDANGQFRLNGDTPVRQHSFAMAAPSPTSSVSMSAVIDTEVQRILNEGRDMARQLLSVHYDQLTLLADALIEHEQLDRAQFETLMKQ